VYPDLKEWYSVINVNAGINLMNLAVNTVGTTEINAHGDNVRLST